MVCFVGLKLCSRLKVENERDVENKTKNKQMQLFNMKIWSEALSLCGLSADRTEGRTGCRFTISTNGKIPMCPTIYRTLLNK